MPSHRASLRSLRPFAPGAAAVAACWMCATAVAAGMANRQVPSSVADWSKTIQPRAGVDRIVPPAGLSLLHGAVAVAVPAMGATLTHLVTVEPAPRVEGANFGYTLWMDVDGSPVATTCEYALLLAPSNADQVELNEQLRSKAPTFRDTPENARLHFGQPSSAEAYSLQQGVLFFVRNYERIDVFLGVAPPNTGQRLNYLLALRDGRTAAVEVSCKYNGGANRFDAVDFGRSQIVVSFDR